MVDKTQAVEPDTTERDGTELPPDEAEHNAEEAAPEPVELSDGSTVQVHQDSEHVGFSEDHRSQPGAVSTIPHSVTVTDTTGDRRTVEVQSAEESAFLHFIVTALDKLGFRRG